MHVLPSIEEYSSSVLPSFSYFTTSDLPPDSNKISHYSNSLVSRLDHGTWSTCQDRDSQGNEHDLEDILPRWCHPLCINRGREEQTVSHHRLGKSSQIWIFFLLFACSHILFDINQIYIPFHLHELPFPCSRITCLPTNRSWVTRPL
jgi:hypothetical protein